jgi:hypothetical protein
VGTVYIPAACWDAFELFTPHGERAWAHNWDPVYPAPTADDSLPGTVFETDHVAGRATWIVCQRDPGRSILYARVLPGVQAGIISVTLGSDGKGRVATVEYRLTALSEDAAGELRRFAAHYPEFLRQWETALAQACGEQTSP